MTMIRVQRREDGVATVWLDHPSKPVNTLSPELLTELTETVAPLLEADDVRAVVVASAKQATFIAGADLEVVHGMSEAEAEALSREGNALLSRIAGASMPVVAAVHGAALGGGLEVALACHYIVASDDTVTVLGQPEVQLGLIPAGGGTQRLVERVGVTTALPLLLTGKRLRVGTARKIGLVDAVTTPGGIAETAARAALALADGRLERPKPRRSAVDRLVKLPPVRALILRQARKKARARTRGNYPAPPAIIDCVATGLKRGKSAGLGEESRWFGQLVPSAEARHLIWIFQAMNEAKKAPDEGACCVRRLSVLGGGFMGSGIASVSLGHCQVTVRDLADDVLADAAKTISEGLGKQIRSGSIRPVEADQRWSSLRLTTDVTPLAGSDLVIEAVFESLELKRKVLAEAEEQIGPEAVFASNTSALPISEIAAEAAHPERVVGMHYFSPVAKMPLLEIVAPEAAAPWAVATARAFGVAQGKTCIVVADGPGFYTTRILAPYLNEAVTLLEEGAGVENVDRAMRDFGYPVGPLALIDEVGIDVGAHVAKDLGEAFAERGMQASEVLPRMQEAGLDGRKGGQGFYVYASKGKRKQPNGELDRFLSGAHRRKVPKAEIQDRLALLMVNEAVHCLDGGVIASPSDGDLGAVLGLGFPPFRGGPFHHVDAVGAATIVDRLHELEGRHGARFAPASGLVEAADGGRRFF